MNTIKYAVLVGFVFLLFSGCMDPASPFYPAEGNGYVLLRFGVTETGRTIMPKTTHEFSRHEVEFTNIATLEVKTVIVESGESFEAVELPAGSYEIKVWAYTHTEEHGHRLAAHSSPVSVTVMARETVEHRVTVAPVAPGDEGAGIFRWNIVYPGDVISATMTITPLDESGTTESSHDLISEPESSCPLNAGYYRVVITLARGGQRATIREVLHIYQNMESVYEMVFSEEHFINRAVTGVTLNKTALTLINGDEGNGDEDTLLATIDPYNATEQGVVWTTNNEAVATVDDTGTVRAVGAGTATITVMTLDGGFSAECAVTVIATTYGVSLSDSGTYAFSSAVYGYSAQTARAVTVTNTGNQSTGALTVALSGTNAGSFTLSTTTVNSIVVGGAGASAFTVNPNTGLAVGTYTATVTVSGGNGISAQFNVSFTVSAISLSINVNAPSSALTPIVNGSYNEYSTTFTVQVSDFAANADANNVGLSISSVTGLTFSGHTSTGNATNGIKTFTVTVTYDGTAAFSSGAATISITGLSGLSSNYSYSGGTITTSVSIIDGQDRNNMNRYIPVHQSNITAFNAYANTTDGLRRSYKLTGNVTLTSPASGGSNWTPMGNYRFDGNTNSTTLFIGSFDGQGYTITNLTINISATFQGMFGCIGDDGVVRNLGLVSVNISGTNGLNSGHGGVAGYNFGTLGNCYVSGNVSNGGNSSSAGGVVGVNYGTVENCYATGNISSGTWIGGVVGRNCSTVKNCYSTTNISATYYGGGVVGGNSYDSTVENCYATGNVDGGGIVGRAEISSGYTQRVQNCVALNRELDGMGRVVHYVDSGVSLSNNYGRQGMILPSGVTATSNATGQHGADVTSTNWNSATWWQNTAQFPSSAWEFRAGLPTLKNMPAGTQNPTVNN